MKSTAAKINMDRTHPKKNSGVGRCCSFSKGSFSGLKKKQFFGGFFLMP